MAYDEVLADRIRDLLAEEPDLTERKMFGGLAFLLGGQMAVAASREGGLLLRADPADAAKAIAAGRARPMVMRGRSLAGWIRVDAEAVASRRQLAAWVGRGVAFVRTLPPKR